MKPSVYLETSVLSYYVSRDSRDVVALAHQQFTRLWWQSRLLDFRAYVSPVVLEEAGRGDVEQARRRLEVAREFPVLDTGEVVEKLAARYMSDLKVAACCFSRCRSSGLCMRV